MFSLPPLQSFMYFSNGEIQLKHTPAARKYFRKNSERAFAGRFRLTHAKPGVREASGCTLSWEGMGGCSRKRRFFQCSLPMWKSQAGMRLGRDEVRKRRFPGQPPQRDSLGCVDSTGVVFQSLWHRGMHGGAQSTGAQVIDVSVTNPCRAEGTQSRGFGIARGWGRRGDPSSQIPARAGSIAATAPGGSARSGQPGGEAWPGSVLS